MLPLAHLLPRDAEDAAGLHETATGRAVQPQPHPDDVGVRAPSEVGSRHLAQTAPVIGVVIIITRVITH